MTTSLLGKSRSSEPPNQTWWTRFEHHPDPLMAFIDYRRSIGHRIYMGINGDTKAPAFADEESQLLVLGPPGAAKTSGPGVINVATAPYSVICSTPRDDFFYATAMIRSRVGEVGVFNFDNRTFQPGAKALYLDPLAGCEVFRVATKEVHRWVTVPDMSESAIRASINGHEHFSRLAEKLLRPLFFGAATLGEDMEWVYGSASSGDIKASLGSLKSTLLDLIDSNDPQPRDRDIRAAVRDINFICGIPAEELGSVVTTAVLRIDAYADPDIVEASKKGNTEFDAWAEGQPNKVLPVRGIQLDVATRDWAPMVGSYPTWYIGEVDPESPIRFLAAITLDKAREAAWARADRYRKAGLPRPGPATVVLDELALMPPQNFRQVLARGRDQALMVVGMTQSISQLEPALGARLARDAIGQFRNLAAYPGIKDPETLDLIKILGGKYYREMPNSGSSNSPQGRTTNVGSSYEEKDRLPPHLVAHGHDLWDDGALFLDTRAASSWFRATTYFKGEPWPRFFVNAAEHAVDAGCTLPLPPLARDGIYALLEQRGLQERFQKLEERLTVNRSVSNG